MLLNVPAVASTTGTTTAITWRSDGVYNYAGQVRVPGSFSSGTFNDGEDVFQNTAGLGGASVGAQSSGNYLTLTSLTGSPASVSEAYIGAISSAVFSPTALPALPPTLFIYIDPIYDALPYILNVANQNFTLRSEPGTISMGQGKNPRQGAAMKFLQCVNPTFTIPTWARSFSLQNISGADLYFRAYHPNSSAYLIDTPAGGLSDTAIVGTKLVDGQSVGFNQGDFSPGASYMLVATLAVTGGAIVEFYP